VYEHHRSAVILRQTPRLRAAVLHEQLLTPDLRHLHGAEEETVEDDERGAWNEVDEDDAKPVVDVEVDVGVQLEEWSEGRLAGNDDTRWIYDRCRLSWMMYVLQKTTDLRPEETRHITTKSIYYQR